MSAHANIQELDGKFRILAELGQGGSANVWLGVARGPRGFSKLVVLKSMKRELKREPELVQMFMNEARLAARLNHPNIVQTNEVFEHDGVPVIVMEYLDGQSLAELLGRHRQHGGFPLPLQLRVLSEALAGLHSAHELTDFDGTPLDVVHRDVSPHNVFVTYAGQTKVIDFGIAKLGSLGETSESGVIRGKLHYMSPEQINGLNVTRRADVYSAGIILWEMAAGVRMWRGVNEAVVMNRVLSGQLPDLLAVNPKVPPRLVEIFRTATAPDPVDRYKTTVDFQLDIDEFLASLAPRIHTRDVGEAVVRMFTDRRAERRQIVERELARVSGQSLEEYGRNRPVPLPTLEVHAENATHMLRLQRRETFRQTVPWLMVGILCTVLIFLLFRLNRPQEVPSPEASAAIPPTIVATEPIRLRITAFPEEARLLLDGRPLTGNPYVGRHAREPGEEHVLQVAADGYEELDRRLVFDRNLDLVLTLRRKAEPTENVTLPSPREPERAATPPPPGEVAKTPPERAKRPATPPAQDRAKEDCTPPYYYDERGVKKYEPACL